MSNEARERDQEISFVIRKKLGILSTSNTGWRKELNLVEWNGRPAKLDIREWDPEHTHMSKGITLRREEAERLQFLLYRFLTGTAKRNDSDKGQAAARDAMAEDAWPNGASVAADAAEPEDDGSPLSPLVDGEAGQAGSLSGDGGGSAVDEETGEIL